MVDNTEFKSVGEPSVNYTINGITGFLCLKESHIAITQVKDKCFFDLFFCRVFDVESIIDKVCQFFKVDRDQIFWKVVER